MHEREREREREREKVNGYKKQGVDQEQNGAQTNHVVTYTFCIITTRPDAFCITTCLPGWWSMALNWTHQRTTLRLVFVSRAIARHHKVTLYANQFWRWKLSMWATLAGLSHREAGSYAANHEGLWGTRRERERERERERAKKANVSPITAWHTHTT